MDMHEFYTNSAKVSRFKALQALKRGEPGTAHKHLRVARRDSNMATLFEPGKTTDIRSVRKSKKKR